MKKLFLLSLVVLGIACEKPADEVIDIEVKEPFKIESITIVESDSGKATLEATINGVKVTTNKVIAEDFSSITFEFAAGFISLTFNDPANGKFGGLLVVEFNGESDSLEFPNAYVTTKPTYDENGEENGGTLTIYGSVDGTILDIEIVI